MNETRYRAVERRLWESVGLEPVERRLPLRRLGGSLRVQEVGSGPPVLFVHGASNSGVSWAPLAARLEGFRCLLLDRPGCGLSEPLVTPLADVERLGAFGDSLLVDVLDALELERAHVVATSYGGYFALRTAAAHSERVDRVIELGWTLGAPLAAMALIMRFASLPRVGRLLARVPPSERGVRAMLRSVGLRGALDSGRFSQVMVDAYVGLLRHTDTMHNDIQVGPRVFSPLGAVNEQVLFSSELLGRIRAPIHFIWGEEDPFGGANIARELVGQIAGATLEFMAGAGHAVWVDDVEHVAARTRAFLEG